MLSVDVSFKLRSGVEPEYFMAARITLIHVELF